MINNSPEDPTLFLRHRSIAWPEDLLQDKNGTILGFLMPEIKDGQNLITVYNPHYRNKKAPDFNWKYLYTTAKNIATIIAILHKKKYVVCDIKQQNFLVQSTGLVSIIDTDSFQIIDPEGKIHRGPVASPEYTPPELFNFDFCKVDRLESHDLFALAIIIWQLLFGNHPFSGKWIGTGNEPDIDTLIYQGQWIYGKNSKLQPTSNSIPLNVIHPELAKLFYQCFDDGHKKPSARPSAIDWKKALEIAISELTLCSSVNNHYYAKNYVKCYWCQRKIQINYDAFPPTLKSFKTPTSVTSTINGNQVKPQVNNIQQVQTLPISQSQPVTTFVINREDWKKALIYTVIAIFSIGWIIKKIFN